MRNTHRQIHKYTYIHTDHAQAPLHQNLRLEMVVGGKGGGDRKGSSFLEFTLKPSNSIASPCKRQT